MSSKQKPFHIFFFPFMAPGHMIPFLNMAKLFTTRGIKSTIVTTPANTSFFANSIEIETLTINFPYEQVGLPHGYESLDSLPPSPDMIIKFFSAILLLEKPFETLVDKNHPNCLIVDYFFPWAISCGAKFGIPCLSFSGTSYFSHCIIDKLHRYEPYKNVSSDFEPFVVDGNLPHEIKLQRSEIGPTHKGEGSKFILDHWNQVREALEFSHGMVMNSFYELETDYVKELGMKNWHIGPFSLWRENGESLSGKKYSIDEGECMRWLDGKESNSVIYVCFGSMSNVVDAQLHEIALALESLGMSFILVVRKEDTKEWVPHGFEEKVKKKDQGLIIRGWAPQGLILDHRALGGFVTHCGWNSILDGVTAGVPMLTWPLHAEQFYNEKLVTDVLKIGVQVGSKKWVMRVGGENHIIDNEKIVKAMEKLLIGEEAKAMRNKAEELKELAKRAISQGGSSCSELDALIAELKSYKN